MIHVRPRVLIGVVLLGLCGTCSVVSLTEKHPTLGRIPSTVPASVYRDEMQCRVACECPGCGLLSGRPSPDDVYEASTGKGCLSLATSWHKFLFHEHCYVREIQVRSRKDGQTIGVLTVKDYEPGSGPSHEIAWSSDSRALFIFGRADLPDTTAEEKDLCVVYEPASDALYQFPDCGELRRTADMSRCRQTPACK